MGAEKSSQARERAAEHDEKKPAAADSIKPGGLAPSWWRRCRQQMILPACMPHT